MNDLFHQKIFAKNENQQIKYPIFQMRECECNHDHLHEWFERFFRVGFQRAMEGVGEKVG